MQVGHHYDANKRKAEKKECRRVESADPLGPERAAPRQRREDIQRALSTALAIRLPSDVRIQGPQGGSAARGSQGTAA